MQFKGRPNTLAGEIGQYCNVVNFILLKSPIPARQDTKLIGMITLKEGKLDNDQKNENFSSTIHHTQRQQTKDVLLLASTYIRNI